MVRLHRSVRFNPQAPSSGPKQPDPTTTLHNPKTPQRYIIKLPSCLPLQINSRNHSIIRSFDRFYPINNHVPSSSLKGCSTSSSFNHPTIPSCFLNHNSCHGRRWYWSSADHWRRRRVRLHAFLTIGRSRTHKLTPCSAQRCIHKAREGQWGLCHPYAGKGEAFGVKEEARGAARTSKEAWGPYVRSRHSLYRRI